MKPPSKTSSAASNPRVPAPAVPDALLEDAETAVALGRRLHDARELQMLSLAEVSRATRISERALELIEAGRFEALPGPVFVRGFLRAYAREVDVDVDAFLGSHPGSVPPQARLGPLGGPAAPERGKSIGMGVALVILLVLFTVAVSVVLSPRFRDTRIELSELAANPQSRQPA